MTISIFERVGATAVNKDIAKSIRLSEIIPRLDEGEKVILDFAGVDSANQSFIHALISDLIRNYGSGVLDKISFKNCNKTVQKIINIVVDYMQASE